MKWLIALLFLIPTAQAAHTPLALKAETVYEGSGVLWGFDFLDATHVLLTFKSGKIELLDLTTRKTVPVAGGPSPLVYGQGGLMDVRVHKIGPQTFVYLSSAVEDTSDRDLNTTAIFRAVWTNNRLEKLQELFRAKPALQSGHHFGSRMAFKNGDLYITIGERNDRDRAQLLSNHLGKVIRLKENGDLPKDNPFVGTPGALPEIYSYGHRNPQGIAIDPDSGQVYVSEHGPRGGDEINLVIPGKNYGWPVVTFGREYSGPQIGDGLTTKPGMEDPKYYYVPSIAPSSLAIATQKAKPEVLRGRHLLGALALQHLNVVQLKTKTESRALEEIRQRIRNVGESPDGTVYVSTDSGKLMRLK